MSFLTQDMQPMRGYHQAKKLLWDPQDFDYTQDKADWAKLTDREQGFVQKIMSLFLAGETYVTHDLAPLLIALRHEGGHLEEEMFLTAQLFEESKHVEFFNDVLEKVVGAVPDFDAIAGENYHGLFEVELAQSLGRLLTDQSREAQVEAIVTYHIIIEGMLAETGYYGLFTALRDQNLMPSFARGLEYVQRDEARHIAFGLHLLTRILTENPELRPLVDARCNALMNITQGIIIEVFDAYLPDLPLGLDLNDLIGYSAKQYMARMNVLERSNTPAV
ncbi:MAG: ribonucleotide-diphosphate reductase subunit beta [Anaerolineales bacterium]